MKNNNIVACRGFCYQTNCENQDIVVRSERLGVKNNVCNIKKCMERRFVFTLKEGRDICRYVRSDELCCDHNKCWGKYENKMATFKKNV